MIGQKTTIAKKSCETEKHAKEKHVVAFAHAIHNPDTVVVMPSYTTSA